MEHDLMGLLDSGLVTFTQVTNYNIIVNMGGIPKQYLCQCLERVSRAFLSNYLVVLVFLPFPSKLDNLICFI